MGNRPSTFDILLTNSLRLLDRASVTFLLSDAQPLSPGAGGAGAQFSGRDGLGEHHSGELRQGSAQAKAQGIEAEDLKRLGWKEADLKSRRKNDPDKLEMAARLRRETTLTIKAIAARVSLGTSKAANAKLHRHMQKRSEPPQSQTAPLWQEDMSANE